jgi:hypothetical protein
MKRPFHAGNVDAPRSSLLSIELHRDLTGGSVAETLQKRFDFRDRDRRPIPAGLWARCQILALPRQPNPSLHGGFAQRERLRYIRVAADARFVGSNHALSELDRIRFRHRPRRSDRDPDDKISDQLNRAVGLVAAGAEMVTSDRTN